MNLIELNRALRQLRLGGMAAVLETRLQQAQAEPMVPIDFLSCLVSDELTRRGDRLLERRRKQAQFRDPQVRFENFDFDFNKKMNRSLVFDLATAMFVARHDDALFLGPPGTGKSHLAQATNEVPEANSGTHRGCPWCLCLANSWPESSNVDTQNTYRDLDDTLKMWKISYNFFKGQGHFPILLEVGLHSTLKLCRCGYVNPHIYLVEGGIGRNLKLQQINSQEGRMPKTYFDANPFFEEIQFCSQFIGILKYYRSILWKSGATVSKRASG